MDIRFNTLQQPSFANGVLTVSDGTHTAQLQFNGSYQLANFKFADDGSPQHGTIVYDPPVSNGVDGVQTQSTAQITPTAASGAQPSSISGNGIVGSLANETPTGNGSNDAFVAKIGAEEGSETLA